MRGHIKKYEGKRGTTYSVHYYLGYDENGKKKYTTKRGFKKLKDAETFLAEITKDIHQGTYVDPSHETLEQFSIRWLEYKKDFVRPRTCHIYERTLRLHVFPKIGRVKISELKPFHLQELYSYLKRNKNLSNRYISQIHNTLHDMFDRALKWEFVPRNITDMVDAPKVTQTKFTVWTLDEVRRFLNSPEVKEHRFYIAFLLALTTGMRQGEIMALKWSDIDFENRTLKVERTMTRDENGKVAIGPPKSESGERVITLPEEVVESLRQHRKNQNEARLKMGSLYQNNDLVVARINGNHVTQTFIRAKFTKLIEELDMPYIRFHDLRHTHSSILLELGEDLKTLQERLGHANYQITADIYTHLSSTLKTRPAHLLSAALFSDAK